MGWASLVIVYDMPNSVGLGIIIHAPHRNKGLGTAIVQYCIDNAAAIMQDPGLTNVLYATTEQNTPMLAIAAKLHLHSLGKYVDKARPGHVMVKFVSKRCMESHPSS